MDMNMETDQLTVTVAAKEDEKLTFEELCERADEVTEKIAGIDGVETIGAIAGGDSALMSMGGSSDSVTMYLLLDENSSVTAERSRRRLRADQRYGLSGLHGQFSVGYEFLPRKRYYGADQGK